MAFCGKFGSLLRQSGQVPMSAMVNSVRCQSTSSTKLFVGGLSWGTNDQSLRDAFANFGEVVEARVITDRESGRSRGFGFVNFSSGDSATNAMQEMDGKDLDGRSIRVNFANDRPAGPRFGGGNQEGGFGGGW